ncbi:MAG: NPCBM/NEW2 domain-containing protein [bacterium]
MKYLRVTLILSVFLSFQVLIHPAWTQEKSESAILSGEAGVEALFEMRGSTWRWVAYRDTETERNWDIGGPCFSVQTPDGRRTNLGDMGFARLARHSSRIVLETDLSTPPVTVRQTYSFCADGRTLRIRTSLRSPGEIVTIQRVGLLEIAISGETLRLTGSAYVSCPVFGERIFAGIEHPSATCQVDGNNLFLAQHSYTKIGKEWIDLPPAIFGSASDADFAMAGQEGLRRAFLRYLNTVRVKPPDMHVHYNDWWTAPVPSSEEFVLNNIDKLKKGLYDQTGFFFDSYALDAGWSDTHSVWEISKDRFPDGFDKIRDSLAGIGSRPGLWVSPSSLYPFALDNAWLGSEGYEVTPHDRLGFTACLMVGGKYQTAFKEAVLKHAREANLGHIKFDGFIPSCDVSSHGHPAGAESYLPIAEGLMEVFDAVREIDPTIALEPTCFGYNPSPWWLMHVPFIIGPFGDDSPKGRVPCPEWIEAMTTAREIKNLEGRDSFLMPSTALQCFDIIVQCPGAFQNHAVMAIGRGRWFISCYINPAFMDAEEWRFFADLMTWARHNREFLQEPTPIGGNPAERQAYGYAFRDAARSLFCLRNPWIEETSIALPDSPVSAAPREVRALYPRRQKLARVSAGESLPSIHLGPYETKFVEVVPSGGLQTRAAAHQVSDPRPSVSWNASYAPAVEHFVFADEPVPFGSSWTCPDGDAKEILIFKLEGDLEVKGAVAADLYVLCEGNSMDVVFPGFELTIDGVESSPERLTSVGAFSAGGHTDEEWVWLKTPFPEGKHRVAIEVRSPNRAANFGVFLRGTVEAPSSLPPFDPGPSFPLFQPETIMWSHAIAPLTGCETDSSRPKTISRKINRIEGVYLDTLEWIEASTGWGEIQLNRSVRKQAMTMGGRIFHRGIGTHAHSRIVYKRPADHETFAATIGCDQKALVGSIVFVVEGDGKELFRSPVLRADSEPINISVPIGGVKEVALIVEDGGDRIAADHGNWAYARFLK